MLLLHTQEVTGSSPVVSTKQKRLIFDKINLFCLVLMPKSSGVVSGWFCCEDANTVKFPLFCDISASLPDHFADHKMGRPKSWTSRFDYSVLGATMP